jgi:hypothetical protein
MLDGMRCPGAGEAGGSTRVDTADVGIGGNTGACRCREPLAVAAGAAAGRVGAEPRS